jgi:hypothetical protein
MKTQTQFFSIFGQIEEVVALQLIEEGVATKIESWSIPQSAKYHMGREAKFAIMIPSRIVPAFEERIAKLRA